MASHQKIAEGAHRLDRSVEQQTTVLTSAPGLALIGQCWLPSLPTTVGTKGTRGASILDRCPCCSKIRSRAER